MMLLTNSMPSYLTRGHSLCQLMSHKGDIQDSITFIGPWSLLSGPSGTTPGCWISTISLTGA